MVCHPDAHPEGLDFSSYTQNRDAMLLPASAVYNFTKFYDPNPTDINFSPLLATDFSRLPPTYMQVSGADPLRDDGIQYAAKLEHAKYVVSATFPRVNTYGRTTLT